MEWLEAAGGERKGSGTREANQRKRAATGRCRERDNRVGEQLRLDRSRRACSTTGHRSLSQATLRDQVLLRNAEQILRGVVQIQPRRKVQEQNGHEDRHEVQHSIGLRIRRYADMSVLRKCK